MLWLNKQLFFRRYLPLILSVILLSVGIGAYFVLRKDTPKADAAWFSTAWTYRTPITIDHNKVNTATGTTTPLTNFPVLVSLTQNFLKSQANGGNVASSTGADILFTDSTGNTQIPYEREFYASSTGQLIAWVKVASLSSVTDTTIYMYYGNATSGLADQQQGGQVWDSNYKSVWHMAENSGNLNDSTFNARTAYPVGSPTYGAGGQIDGALSVTKASTQYATTTPANSLNQPTFTIEAWFTDGLPSASSGSLYAENGNAGFQVSISKPGFSSNVTATVKNNFSPIILTSTANVASGLHHVAFVKNSNSDWVLYVDGVSDRTATTTLASGASATNSTIGNDFAVTCTNGCWTGIIDEVRVSHVNRSADWIATEYANQNNPTTFLSLGGQQSQNWYPGWSYRKMIVIDHNKVSQVNGTSLSNFPMLYSVTDSSLAYTSFGGGVASSTGGDILFTSSDGITKIPYEREYYASSTGQLISWVQIPSLSPTTDTVIYVYYGNSSNITDQQQASSVWDSNYKGVWHLSNGSSLSANDSTSNAVNGTITTATAANGQVDGAASFDNSANAKIDLGTTSLISQSSAKSAFAWIKPDANATSTFGRIFQHDIAGSQWALSLGANGQAVPNAIGGTPDNNSHYGYSPANSVPRGAWSYVGWTFDGTNFVLYVNGVPQTQNTTDGVFGFNSGNVYIGYRNNAGLPVTKFYGIIDEVKISNTARSEDWVKTEYNNQNSPSTFYSTQSQQVVSSSATPHTGLKAPSTGWYNTAWPYRMAITIDHTKVSTASSTTLTNFPFLASTTSASLKSIPNGGGVASSTGADILFTSSDGVTKLPHEIESYASTTGALAAWVKLPSLSPTTDTVLYMYYGNQTSGLANQQQVTSVWDSSFSAVWHFKETPSGTAGELRDSTSNGVNGQTFGSMGSGSQVSGQIGGSLTFLRPSLQYADFGSPASSEIGTGDFTIGTWVAKNATSSSFNDTFIVNKWNTGTAFGTNEWSMGFDQSGTDNKPNFVVESGNTSYTANDPNNLNVGQWYYLVGVRSGTSLLLYRNGLLVATATMPSNTSVNNIPARTIRFARSNIPLYSSMTTDETRMAQTARSADWIITEYNNQGNTASFETWSGQQSVSGGVSAWKDTGWTSRKTLIINHEKVSGNTALTNFPVLVSVTDADLRTVANGGQMGQSDGHDVYFTAGDGTTALSYEREKYTASTGELVAWVKIPSLSPTQDTTIYMYYGNSSASLADQQQASLVWDSNYAGVWHMASTSSAPDSTSNSNNGALSAGSLTNTSGQFGSAVSFNGGTFLTIPAFSFNNTNESWSAWVNPATTSSRITVFDTGFASAASHEVGNPNSLTGSFAIDTGSFYVTTNSGTVPANTWTHIAVNFITGTAQFRTYINGVLAANNVTSQNFTGSSGSTTMYIGQRTGGSQKFSGSVEEIRLSSVNRSADWIKTEYNNQSSPSTFVYVGQRDTTQRATSTPSLKAKGNVRFR